MTCAEKKELQDHCITAFDELEQLKSATGVLHALRTKTFSRKSFEPPLLPQTSEFATLTEAMQKWNNASKALSRHLSTHRC